MSKVYLDTSFVSACVTERDDPSSVYRRVTSLAWWSSQRRFHEILVSAEVVDELSAPGYRQRVEALNWIRQIPIAEIDERVRSLAATFVAEKVMPAPVAGDAIHVAVACIHRIEYLLSWNVRHLANPNKLAHLSSICARTGIWPPRIVTPDLLWERNDEA